MTASDLQLIMLWCPSTPNPHRRPPSPTLVFGNSSNRYTANSCILLNDRDTADECNVILQKEETGDECYRFAVTSLYMFSPTREIDDSYGNREDTQTSNANRISLYVGGDMERVDKGLYWVFGVSILSISWGISTL